MAMKIYRVSALTNGSRVFESSIKAVSEKQARFFFSAPLSKGGKGHGFACRDWCVYEAPNKQLTLDFTA